MQKAALPKVELGVLVVRKYLNCPGLLIVPSWGANGGMYVSCTVSKAALGISPLYRQTGRCRQAGKAGL